VKATAVEYQTSLSAARNILLSKANSNGLLADATIVGFPDDDCWYPAGTLEHVIGTFSKNSGLDLWFCRYASNPVSIVDVTQDTVLASPRDVIRNASSNTMFVRGRVLHQGVTFDENLGVGTVNNGAEDTEFALHSYITGAQSMYLPVAAVGHRDKNSALRAKYYRGGLIAIARYALYEPRIGVELIRKILVGLYLVVRGELSPAGFGSAVGMAFKMRNAYAKS
jgi:hypothetical protein